MCKNIIEIDFRFENESNYYQITYILKTRVQKMEQNRQKDYQYDSELYMGLLLQMLCEEQGFFLEIADIIRGFDLNILKGVTEIRENKIWASFIVEVKY